MKIILTGGGTGGHFYPLISVAEELNKEVIEKRLLEAKLYYMAPVPYDENLLFNNHITFIPTSAGKMRTYSSIWNFFDLFKTAWGALKALWKIFTIFPDVIFGKGGYVSFPALLAARILGIPVVIHESDSVPGRVNAWAGKFAKRIAISYPSAAEFFPKDRVALTGNPIRAELMTTQSQGAHEYLHLEPGVPTIFVMGGSSGSQIINANLIDALPVLLNDYQVIHQTGKDNYIDVTETASVLIEKHPSKSRYHAFPYLDTLAQRMSAGVADLMISRAGGTIFEIAIWKIPAILIPITESNGDHQRKNAYAYARTGAAVVIEEANLNHHIIEEEVARIMGNAEEREKMKKAAQEFARPDAAKLIAGEIINIALQHER